MKKSRTKRTAQKAAIAVKGQRVGSKRRDMRWEVDGVVWASRFEYQVFVALQQAGYHVRKTGPQDRLAYTDAVAGGECTKCGARACVTRRYYTPDLFVGRTGNDQGEQEGGPATSVGYYIETKGYLRAPQRSLLRSLRKTWPTLDLRLVLQRDYRVTAKLSMSQWAEKFLKVKVHVWDGKLPEGWKL